MKIDLSSKRACIFGMPGEGKSNFLCWLAEQYGGKAFLYDTTHEFPTDKAFDVYRPADRYSVPELERILRGAIKLKKYKLMGVDETNRFCPSKPAPLPEYIAELNDMIRHPEYGNVTPVWIARRPTQLNQDLTELAHYLFIFNLKGKNDIDYLEGFAPGLGKAVFSLPQYHFIAVNQRREFQLMRPIPLSK